MKQQSFRNFAGHDLQGASFRGQSVLGCNFAGADLRGADFRGALALGDSPVSFRGADLRGADFRNVAFQRADFSGARIDGALGLAPVTDPRDGARQVAIWLRHGRGWYARGIPSDVLDAIPAPPPVRAAS